MMWLPTTALPDMPFIEKGDRFIFYRPGSCTEFTDAPSLRVRWNDVCTPSMGMNLWGESPLSENSTLTMLTIITTSRRQRQSREGLSEGSLSAKRRADEQTTAWMPEVEQCRSNCRNRIQGGAPGCGW